MNHPKSPNSQFKLLPSAKVATNWKNQKINRTDLIFIVIALAMGIYLLATKPIFMTILGCASIIFLSMEYVIRTVPILEHYLGRKIRFWHLVTAIIAVTAVLDTFATPAHAIFLSGLEQFFVTLAQQSSQAGGGTNTLDANVVGLTFNLIRGAFLLLVAAASLFAYNQAQQGNDWRPIVTQVGLAFAIVIAIDVITFIFIGNGTGGGV
ncbi:hypothetical protein H6G54_29335 [Anabaena cylindrica FACHB-243]|uniref:Uncharacterized protein n=1 Tax=Anabaena cylindrica (strain ATCC 27899 / PCC 7122) TaxID=272123 RepID=K9ZR04_ANACC|nr:MULTISPECIES: hypothetical protein [Anabaena]AFZ60992.1 hypothetical protein Anacy_5687 [Anabaena cylindrica PCC 7122]MBD2421708.1 hypothetical protein [Anabaena cylindrica FACHB-243]MBY5281449.1 hypothetical protein [Anabaena sp. CCAP 1446/1C]MBY5309509.1 hypothetical protein [Anabaena sp. CCAP 1446/1C]MCM2409019.1 hypothetical protein [Anabaena sp. CCAP 1446/1C]